MLCNSAGKGEAKMFHALRPVAPAPIPHYLYRHTSCSQCGKDLGPGHAGTSHCARHAINTRPFGIKLPTDRELIALISKHTGLNAWEAHGVLSSFDVDGVADELLDEDRDAA
jgi:hypothetical protein